MTIRQVLEQAAVRLTSHDEASATIYPLLAHCLSSTKEYIWAHPNVELSNDVVDSFFALVERANLGEPLAYLVGHKEFYGRDFFVTQNTLIPRPETECLVDTLITFLSASSIANPIIVDVGTGSGCIAITLAAELPQSNVLAIDVSSQALDVARQNATTHNISNIAFEQGSLLSPLNDIYELGSIDAIVANLPYISDEEYGQLPITVKNFEPPLALRSGVHADALNFELITQAKLWLKQTGILIYETTNGKLVTINASDIS